MSTKYKIVSEPFKHFYSDDIIYKADPIMGVDLRDPTGVAYTVYNKPYGKFQNQWGCTFQFPDSIPFRPGMDIDFYADNSTTNILANSFTQKVPSGTGNVRAYMPKAAMAKLGNGLIDCYGSVTDPLSNTVYIMNPHIFTIQTP